MQVYEIFLILTRINSPTRIVAMIALFLCFFYTLKNLGAELRGIFDPNIFLKVLAYPEVELRGMRERDSSYFCSYYCIFMFEFDETTSGSNMKKHGMDFETVKILWKDHNRVEIPSRWLDEPRYILIARD